MGSRPFLLVVYLSFFPYQLNPHMFKSFCVCVCGGGTIPMLAPLSFSLSGRLAL